MRLAWGGQDNLEKEDFLMMRMCNATARDVWSIKVKSESCTVRIARGCLREGEIVVRHVTLSYYKL